jgi:hypothetical protein
MIKLLNILNELLFEKKLCPKGKAYYDRRISAGEKPSAYLSGRSVKVCKGLINEYEDLSIENNYVDKDGELDWEQLQADLIKLIPYFRSQLPNYLNDKSLNDNQINQLIEQFIDNLTDIWESTWMSDTDKLKLKSTWRKADINTLSDRFIAFVEGLSDNWEEYPLDESLRDWFEKEDWVRIDTAGNITGPCGTMKKGNKTTRCLPHAKANSLTQAERAATSKKKAASDKQFVPNTEKAKVKLNEIEDQTITCEECGWYWPLSDGGNDPYVCHKCGHDNTDEYDVENEQDIKEFIEFITEYNKTLNEANCDCVFEAKYQGRTVSLGKPMRGDSKKFKVYVKNPKGKVVKVNFGAKGMNIKKNNPVRRRAFRARFNCDSPGPRTKARYWSCRKW